VVSADGVTVVPKGFRFESAPARQPEAVA